MSQININPSATDGNRAATASINLLTALVVLAVLLVLAWAIFAGPLRTVFYGRNGNANPPPRPEQQKTNPSGSQPQQQQPIPLHLDQMRAFMLESAGLEVA